MGTEDWKLSASCRGQSKTPDSLWWTVGIAEATAEAKRTCAGCIVQEECLEYALAFEGSTPAEHRTGIWGGKTATERGRLWRARNKRQTVPHEPVWRTCACGCSRTFDAWRTVEGKPRRTAREFSSRDCQLDYIHRKQTKRPRLVLCKLPDCQVMFQQFTTQAGLPTAKPRSYCCADHQKLGVRITLREQRARTHD